MLSAPVRRARREERGVVGEVVVDRPPLHAGASRYLGDRGRGGPTLEMQPRRRLDDPAPRVLGLLRPLLEFVLSRHFALQSVHRSVICSLYGLYSERRTRCTATPSTCSISGRATSWRATASRSSSTRCLRARSALPCTGTRARTSTHTSWKAGSARSSGSTWSKPDPASSCRSPAARSTHSGTPATSRCASSRSSRRGASRSTSASSRRCSLPETRMACSRSPPATSSRSISRRSPCSPSDTASTSRFPPDLRPEQLVDTHRRAALLAFDDGKRGERRAAPFAAAEQLPTALCAGVGHVLLELLEPAVRCAATETECDPVPEDLPTLLPQPVRRFRHVLTLAVVVVLAAAAVPRGCSASRSSTGCSTSGSERRSSCCPTAATPATGTTAPTAGGDRWCSTRSCRSMSASRSAGSRWAATVRSCSAPTDASVRSAATRRRSGSAGPTARPALSTTP